MGLEMPLADLVTRRGRGCRGGGARGVEGTIRGGIMGAGDGGGDGGITIVGGGDGGVTIGGGGGSPGGRGIEGLRGVDVPAGVVGGGIG